MLPNLSAVPLVIGLRRYASAGAPIYVGFLAGRTTVPLSIPRDGSARVWLVSFNNPRHVPGVAVSVCPTV